MSGKNKEFVVSILAIVSGIIPAWVCHLYSPESESYDLMFSIIPIVIVIVVGNLKRKEENDNER